ncbi:MAG: ribonuclease D, partial [Anaerolineae bacterium]|nr:ribonuclease D [Anaerolineae bacterium]
MNDRPLPPAVYIDHDREFRRLAGKLVHEPLLAIDTESNSLYAYRERVCLIQISTRKQDFIVDPLRVADLAPLGDLLANPRIEKVFHAAESDLTGLKRDYEFELHNLFDTLVAARICGLKAVGLSALLTDLVDPTIVLDKSHQLDDWGIRPLFEDSLRYAQMDTHYLPVLRDRLYARLEENGLMEEAQELFIETCQVTVTSPQVDPQGYWKIGMPRGLTPRQMAILRRLYLLRETVAEEIDLPSFKIMNDNALCALAELAPAARSDLERIRGLNDQQINRYGEQILQAVAQGRQDPPCNPPKRRPHSDAAQV